MTLFVMYSKPDAVATRPGRAGTPRCPARREDPGRRRAPWLPGCRAQGTDAPSSIGCFFPTSVVLSWQHRRLQTSYRVTRRCYLNRHAPRVKAVPIVVPLRLWARRLQSSFVKVNTEAPTRVLSRRGYIERWTSLRRARSTWSCARPGSGPAVRRLLIRTGGRGRLLATRSEPRRY